MVGDIIKGIGLYFYLNCECNCDSTTKVKITCVYRGECRACCVILIRRQYLLLFMGNTKNTLKKILEQHFQYVAQKAHHDKKTRYLCGLFCSTCLSKTQPHNIVVK